MSPVALATSLIFLLAPSSYGANKACAGGSASETNGYTVALNCESTGGGGVGGSSGPPDPYEDYRWRPGCAHPGMVEADGAQFCALTTLCPDDAPIHVLEGLKDGTWHGIKAECRGDATVTPTITPALVSTAFQRIPLPHLRTIAQPGAKTLVNFDTIFRVEAHPLQRHLTLLGQRVDLDISPTSFTWTWGDGHTDTTHTPGAPYPAKTVTHRYLDADTTVRARVTVTWTARWRVNGGAWADVPGSVRTTGPAATLRVVEAVPNLAGSD